MMVLGLGLGLDDELARRDRLAMAAAPAMMIAQPALIAPQPLFDPPGGDIEAGEDFVRLALALQGYSGTDMYGDMRLETTLAAFEHHMGIDRGGEIFADRRFKAFAHMFAQALADSDMSAFDGELHGKIPSRDPARR